MKKSQRTSNLIILNTTMIWVMLLGIMLVLIFKDFSPTVICGNEETTVPSLVILTKQDTTAEDGTKGTIIRIAKATPETPQLDEIIIWNECPEKEQPKESTALPTKRISTHTTRTIAPQKQELEEAIPLAEATTETRMDNETTTNQTIAVQEESLPIGTDTIRVEVIKTTADTEEQLFYHQSIRHLPLTVQGMLRDEGAFRYDINQDLSAQIAAWNAQQRKAKKHLIIGTSLVGLSALGYTATELVEIPTLVEWNGLDPFDPANKYYDHNVQQDKNLKTLRWTRAGIIAVGAIGGFELVRGISLLKPITLDVAPSQLTFKYTF